AHEIKNPLTPMKLNIQHLQRTLNNLEKDELISKVTKTSEILIEQIDTLSSIASAFSSFAKMPEPNIEKINIINLLQDTVHLFRDTENTEISFASGGIKELNVLADREHFKRAVLNLIKNAIQAISENTQGQVAVSVSKNYGKVLIQVKDDGVGISEENRMKIFQPNFSTKTEGMGLGLALVKSAVESFGGKIYFETKIGEGSSFTIELEEAKN
ncbi:MAG: sensor histidine kinase, partial [Bacteroidota bacterium]